MARLTYLLCSLLSIFNLGSCYLEYKPATEKERKALFVFGDSLFDAGNNGYLNISTCNVASLNRPYGETFFKHPTGRFSDGRLVPDFIATLAGLPILHPYLEPNRHDFTNGTNFASAGACVLNGSKCYIDLPGQIEFFKNVVGLLKKDLGHAQAMKVLTNAVYFFSIGGNDYNVFYSKHPNATEVSRTAFVKQVTANLYKSLLEVTSLGARKFALQSVGPVGCIPLFNRLSDGECVKEVNAMAVEHNKALPEVLKKLESEIPGFKYSIFDYYNAMMVRFLNPRKYGFKEGRIACCGDGPSRATNCGSVTHTFQLCPNPFEYLWFDGSHATEGAHVQLSQLIWEGPTNVTGPYTVQQLFQI